MQQLYSNAPIANFSVIGIAFFCMVILWQKVETQPLVLWFITLTTVALIRVILVYHHKRHNKSHTVKQYALWYTIATLLVSCCWALFCQFLLSEDPFVHYFVIIVIVGVITASVPVLAMIKVTFFAYILPPVITSILILLTTQNTDAHLLASCMAIYATLIGVTGSNLNHRTRYSLQLEADNKELIAHLVDEIDQKHAIQKDLELAMEASEKANISKSEFLANMSHEIRTPMNVIIGLSHLALKRDPSPKIEAYLDKIHLSGQHLLGIINNILDFSKIEAGKLEIEKTSFTMEQVMNTLTTITINAIQEKGLTFNLNIDPALAIPLKGDPLRLGQILINLTNNAIKFTNQGGINVSAQLQQACEERLQVYFEVQDSGIGMTQSQQKKLFNAFQQAEVSTSRTYGGTGLGLVISKQLAELMEGEIGITSAPGQGSTFWFTAYFERDFEPTEQSSNTCNVAVLSGARILVVDDNVLNQQIAQELLYESNVITEVASDGLEAIDMVSSGCFDAVLMDIQMPILGGLEATRLIRMSATGRELPIIAMTANATKQERERCLAAGMNDFIPKPVQPDQLDRTLARWLQQRTTKTAAKACEPSTHSEHTIEALFPR
ncbi:MAG: ATP-binding protein [Candidatus Polarisedimenticolaceae bacterium]|nr:ATP-binding protein [Candidatus Polarisedimenticolaceae bacterium]